MDTWSARMRRHTEEDSGLRTGWAGSTWTRTAEIIRYDEKAGWPADRDRRFEHMLRTACLPAVTQKVPDCNGNRDLVMTDAAIGIAVFLNDHKAFDHAVERFRERVPAYFCLEEDGTVPLTPPGSTVNTPQKLTTYWFKQTTFKDGLCQETCRNLKHVGYPLAATAHIAETAWHQGVDLYGEVKDRLRAALDFHARYQSGGPVPTWLCGGKVVRNMGPDLEGRTGVSVPAAHKLAEKTRPAPTVSSSPGRPSPTPGTPASETTLARTTPWMTYAGHTTTRGGAAR